MISTRGSFAVLAAGLALALAGCGSGSDSGAGGSAAKAAPSPEPTVAASGPAQARSRRPVITTGKTPPTRARDTEAAEKSANPADGGGVNPCSLVSRARARAIVGTHVAAPNLALQGPTCVYATPKQSITLALQSVQASSVTRAARSTIKLKVAGKPAFCVTQGGNRVLVPLGPGRTLVVAAACPIAARFASEALRRLDG